MTEVCDPALLLKYDQPVPRYTSYPTVPFWKDGFDREDWKSIFAETFHKENHVNGISLYIHLPFCESLCTYCGCNKKITTNHQVEDEYISAILTEWKMYRRLMKQTPVIHELHLGGGTPTFFSPRNLEKLIGTILKDCVVHPNRQFSFEGHPNNTTAAHLQKLFKIGFRRVSYGVQDNDEKVQRIINRIQPFSNVEQATKSAREIGFTSVNFDLIYGLPLQTVESVTATINKVLELRPDRIAFYSYAHVPWVSRGQRLFDTGDLPKGEDKLNLYLKGKEILLQNGYVDIGMDHFSLPDEELAVAKNEGRLHRNFMGYTTTQTALLLGLGVSSISDAGTGYVQNQKKLTEYYKQVKEGIFPVAKGYRLSPTDQRFRRYITEISCKGETKFDPQDLPLLQQMSFPKLREMEKEGLVILTDESLTLTAEGGFFRRNVCATMDMYMIGERSGQPVYSQAI